jgi:iron complex outermembrane receptor protein
VAPTPLQQEIYIPSGTDPNSGLPIVIRGNADGFTLLDGTEIPALKPEKIQTWEVGYKGAVTEDLYLDVNGYRSFQEDFVAPLQVIGVANMRGDVSQSPEIVLTYQNFGEVNPYGVDATVNYEISDRLSLKGTYSFFDASFDEETFDLNDDGAVTPDEISLNAPKHKGSITGTAQNLLDQGIFGNVTVRYVAEYDFVSGVHFAADEQEGQRVVLNTPSGPVAFNHNYGPLGGFTTVNLNVGYRILPELSLSVGALNLFDAEQREFAGSPSVGRMITTRLRADF